METLLQLDVLNINKMIRSEIKKALKEGRITQTELANRVGITKSHMSDFLSGNNGIKIEILEAIFQELDLKIKKRDTQ